MSRLTIALASCLLAAGGAVSAQEVSVPSVTVANPGGYANPLKLDTDRYKRTQGKTPRTRTAASPGCSVNALPAAERRDLEREYGRRAKADGKASADRWVAEQGRQFRARLVAQGICPSEAAAAPARKAEPRSRKGGKCTKTVMQARNIANPGGGAMSMVMVPVCVN